MRSAQHLTNLAIATLSCLAAGHQCADGSWVRCMAVSASSRSGAPSSYGQSFGAAGSPMCTPDGRKVYCLANHDYHQCSPGNEPCCQDGSNPHHGGTTSQPSDNVQCAAPTQVATAAPTPAPTPAPSTIPVFELDDLDPSATDNRTYRGDPSFPCMKDAYKGQFRHDWFRNKGSASFQYQVSVSKSGCYMIEEYHPGSLEKCSQYLPNNARLEVNYCKGRSKNFSIDQSIRPAQWNHVASLMFYQGVPGSLVMKNAVGEKCVAVSQGDKCLMMADAFRLTWKGATCDAPVTTQAPAATQTAKTPVVTVTQKIAPQTSMKMASIWDGKAGMLMIEAGLTHNGDVLLQLNAEKGTFETALAVHLGLKKVNIVSIMEHGRRLHDAGTQHPKWFEVRFVAKEIFGNALQSPLIQTLRDALNKAGSGITLQRAIVRWGWQVSLPSEQKADEHHHHDSFVFHLVIGAACVLSILFAVSVTFWCCRTRKRRQSVITPVEVVGKESAEDLNNASVESTDDVKTKEGNHKDSEIASVSTGTPSSDDDLNSEGNIVTTPSASMMQVSASMMQVSETALINIV